MNNGGGAPEKESPLGRQAERVKAASEDLQRRQRMFMIGHEHPDYREFVSELAGLEPFIVQQITRQRALAMIAKQMGVKIEDPNSLLELEKALTDADQTDEIRKVAAAFMEGMGFAVCLERQRGDAPARAAELRLVKENLHLWGVGRDTHDTVEANIDARIAELEAGEEPVEGEAVDEPSD